MFSKKLIVALDFSSFQEVNEFIKYIDPSKCLVKVGLQLYTSCGRQVIELLAEKGFEIFLDLKLHDIPNTVKKTINEISSSSIVMTTIHLSGGEKMIDDACDSKGNIKIIGVSLLTSLDQNDVNELYNRDIEQQIMVLKDLASRTKIDGIVCSPKELPLLSDFKKLKIVPGIRNINGEDDQKRVLSSKEAYANGADYIVVGRPITEAADKSKAFNDYL